MINKTNEMVKNTHELIKCVLAADIKEIKNIIKNKPILIDLINDYEETALISNSINNCNKKGVEIANILLDAGADINAGDNNNDSPLQFAIEYNNIPVVEVLLKRGANISYDHDSSLTYGTMLLQAINQEHLEITLLFLKYGADPTEQHNDISKFAERIKFSSDEIQKHFSKYEVQKELIDKYPSVYFDFKNQKLLDRKIKKEYKHLEAASQLNLLS